MLMRWLDAFSLSHRLGLTHEPVVSKSADTGATVGLADEGRNGTGIRPFSEGAMVGVGAVVGWRGPNGREYGRPNKDPMGDSVWLKQTNDLSYECYVCAQGHVLVHWVGGWVAWDARRWLRDQHVNDFPLEFVRWTVLLSGRLHQQP